MDQKKLLELQDMASEIRLNADALKALASEFGDDFCTDRDPEKLARNIRNRPDIYVNLWYLLFGLVCNIAEAMHKLDDGLSEE